MVNVRLVNHIPKLRGLFSRWSTNVSQSTYCRITLFIKVSNAFLKCGYVLRANSIYLTQPLKLLRTGSFIFIFLDAAKAFVGVLHLGLLTKLSTYESNACRW